MSTPPKKDPLSSLFGQAPSPPDPTAPSDTPEPGQLRATKPVNRPMPPPTPPSAGPDPRALAKILAKAAQAKAGAPASRPAAAAPEAKVEAKPVIRGVAAAPPPQRKLSALEAMDLARKQEADEKATNVRASQPPAPQIALPPAPTFTPAPTASLAPAAPRPAVLVAAPAPALAPPAPVLALPPVATVTEDQLGDIVQSVLGAGLPGAQVYIANAMFADDRKPLTALWRSHRARFLATHQVEYAVGATVVLHHLINDPPQTLAVAHGVTDKGEFLLWVDVGGRRLITAFANPRQLVAGW